MDIDQFSELLKELRESDNEKRSNAENIFYEQINLNPSLYINHFLSIIGNIGNYTIKSQCLILLTYLYSTISDETFQKINTETHQALYTNLVSYFTNHIFSQDQMILLSSKAASIARIYLQMHEFNDFLPSLLEVGKQFDPILSVAAMDCLTICMKMPDFDWNTCDFQSVFFIVQNTLTNDVNPSILASSLRLLYTVIINEEIKENASQFAPAISECYQRFPEPMLHSALFDLLCFIRFNADFFISSLEPIISFMIRVYTSHDVLIASRLNSLDVMTGILESLALNSVQYLRDVLISLMVVGSESPDDRYELSDEDKYDVYISAESQILTLSKVKIFQPTFNEIALELINQNLQTNNSADVRMALETLSQIIVGASSYFNSSDISEMIQCILHYFDHENPNCRIAAYYACSDFSTSFKMYMPLYHETIVSSLISNINKEVSAPARINALLALSIHCENCTYAIMENTCGSLIQFLVPFLSEAHYQEHAPILRCISVLSKCNLAGFTPYYNEIINSITQILLSNGTDEYGHLRARAIECFSFLWPSAPSIEQYSLDTSSFFQIILQWDWDLLTLEEVIQIYEAIRNISTSSKDVFQNYFPEIFQRLYNKIEQEPDTKNVSTGEYDSYLTPEKQVIYFSDTNSFVEIDRSQVKILSEAIITIKHIAKAVKNYFYPYIIPVTKVLLKIITHSNYTADVQKISIKCLVQFSKILFQAKGEIEPIYIDFLKTLMGNFIGFLSLPNQYKFEKWILNALYECICCHTHLSIFDEDLVTKLLTTIPKIFEIIRNSNSVSAQNLLGFVIVQLFFMFPELSSEVFLQTIAVQNPMSIESPSVYLIYAWSTYLMLTPSVDEKDRNTIEQFIVSCLEYPDYYIQQAALVSIGRIIDSTTASSGLMNNVFSYISITLDKLFPSAEESRPAIDGGAYALYFIMADLFDRSSAEYVQCAHIFLRCLPFSSKFQKKVSLIIYYHMCDILAIWQKIPLAPDEILHCLEIILNTIGTKKIDYEISERFRVFVKEIMNHAEMSILWKEFLDQISEIDRQKISNLIYSQG